MGSSPPCGPICRKRGICQESAPIEISPKWRARRPADDSASSFSGFRNSVTDLLELWVALTPVNLDGSEKVVILLASLRNLVEDTFVVKMCFLRPDQPAENFVNREELYLSKNLYVFLRDTLDAGAKIILHGYLRHFFG